MNDTLSILTNIPSEQGSENLMIFLKYEYISLVIFVSGGTICSLKTAAMLIYMLRCKWMNSDFFFLMVSIYNLIFCLGSIYNVPYVLKNSRPNNYFEILIMGILFASYFYVYATALLITSLEIWLAVQTPFWHRIHVTKKRVIICCLLCTTSCVLFHIVPEIISPGKGYIYIEELFITSISPEETVLIIYNTWPLMLSIESLITFVVALVVVIIVKKHNYSRARILGITRNLVRDSCQCRKMLLTFIHLTRFCMLWFLFLFVFTYFKENTQIYFGLIFLNCIGDGTIQCFLMPRYKKLRADLITKFARESKLLFLVACIFI